MTSSRTSEHWTTTAALFVLIGAILLPTRPVAAATGPDALLSPTPLVLKDGRIANVSIHVLPFGSGDGELAGDTASRLAALTAQVATDCFLTAQVIGHVSSREVAENETLAAHRLARSRADAVQASLIGGGLPAKSIASVWDWQFLVREPRATLWVFRLIQGEDCEGQPLDGSATNLVADKGAEQAVPAQTSPAQTAAAAAPRRATPAEDAPVQVATAEPSRPAPAPQPTASAARAPAPPAEVEAAAPPASSALSAEPVNRSGSSLAGMVSTAVAAESSPGAEHAESAAARAETAAPSRQAGAAPTQAQPAKATERPERVVVLAGPARDTVPTITRPLPALSPAQPDRGSSAGDDRSGDTTVAVTGPSQRSGAAASQQSAKPADPEREGKVEWGQDGNVVITFATNSSYFPPGTTRRLRSMIGNMTSDGRYRVQLEVGVSGSDKVVGASSPEEAKRYNQWLAERRMARVQEWLAENAKDRQIEIEPAFQADDSSRRVVVRVLPTS